MLLPVGRRFRSYTLSTAPRSPQCIQCIPRHSAVRSLRRSSPNRAPSPASFREFLRYGGSRPPWPRSLPWSSAWMIVTRMQLARCCGTSRPGRASELQASGSKRFAEKAQNAYDVGRTVCTIHQAPALHRGRMLVPSAHELFSACAKLLKISEDPAIRVKTSFWPFKTQIRRDRRGPRPEFHSASPWRFAFPPAHAASRSSVRHSKSA